jgi:cell division protease FtsH
VNNQWFSKVAVWLVIALVLFTVFKQFDRGVAQGNQIAYSDFLEEVKARRIKSVTLQENPGGGTEIQAVTVDDRRLRSTAASSATSSPAASSSTSSRAKSPAC